VIEDLLEQTYAALARKEKPLRKCRGAFETAWLAVGSHLTCGLSDHDTASFTECFSPDTGFDAVLLFDANNPERTRKIVT